jgi:hypothetical protein
MRWSFSRGSTGGKRKLHATGMRSSDKRFGSAESAGNSNFNMPISSPNGVPDARFSIGH